MKKPAFRQRKLRNEGDYMNDSTKQEIISWIKTIVLSLILAGIVNTFLIVNAQVPTGSMENTIMPKDRIVASRLSYIAKDPERGDVVIFRYPDDLTGKTLFVKRVIGLPGDTVEIHDGNVYINQSDIPLEEPYIKEITLGDFGPYLVPEGEYFMLGDNRNNSKDSRFWQNTYVKKDKILGKVLFRFYKGFKKIT